MSAWSLNVIENEVAYENARHARIIGNAHKTFCTDPDNKRAFDYLQQFVMIERGKMVFTSRDLFVNAMAENLFATFGKLTPRQVEVVIGKIEKAEARRREWDDKRAAEKAASNWIGELGDKVEIELQCFHEVDLGAYTRYSPTTYLYICKTPAGDAVIYKGTADFIRKGERGIVKATVKELGVRDGCKQTVIARPKVVEIIGGEA
jgi:hypothetical protein